MNRFDIVYEQVLNGGINTLRKPIKKIDQMTTKQFLGFLRDIIPLFKNGQLDFQNIDITQKIDGQAYRIIVNDGKMMFQGSTGGVKQANNMTFPYKAIGIKKLFQRDFLKLSQYIRSDFKIIGQLIWTKDLIQNGKITPICASYLADKFGEYGGMVIFDVKKIQDNELKDFSQNVQNFILEKIKSFSNKDFVFYNREDIRLYKENINFKLNIDQLSELVKTPQFNKQRYSKVKDKQIIQKIQQIKKSVIDQLEDIINNTHGRFSQVGDLIQGIVLRNKLNGNQYGIFSNNYKQMKKHFSYNMDNYKELYQQFNKELFGYSLRWQIEKNLDKIDLTNKQELFNNRYQQFLNKMKEIIITLQNDKNIPIGAKNPQLQILNSKYNYFRNNVKTFDDYIRKIIKNEK